MSATSLLPSAAPQMKRSRSEIGSTACFEAKISSAIGTPSEHSIQAMGAWRVRDGIVHLEVRDSARPVWLGRTGAERFTAYIANYMNTMRPEASCRKHDADAGSVVPSMLGPIATGPNSRKAVRPNLRLFSPLP